jgi:glycosyltransferase involved in cell wall biosynthesis
VVTVVDPQLVDAVSAEAGEGVPVRIIANAVDVDRFKPGPERRSSLDVLAVGRLVHAKGFDDLLNAWVTVVSTHPHARLTIVGDGPLRGRLAGLASSLGIAGSVQFTGALTGLQSRDLIGLYQNARVLVQPSHHEGLSTVVLEAMACSTPVIATAVGAHPTVIADGVNGGLVPPRQPVALAQAMNRLLVDSAWAARLGQMGRKTVVESYSWTAVARAYESLYEELVTRANRVH